MPPVHGLDHTKSTQSGMRLPRVPVVRLFGSTVRGQKVCMHVHRAYPYLFVLLDESVALRSQRELEQYAAQFAHNVELALSRDSARVYS